MSRLLIVGVLLLLFDLPGACAATSQSHISGVAISPDGKLIAVAFRTDSTSFIYKIDVDTGIAIRLTNAKVVRNQARLSRQTGTESRSLIGQQVNLILESFWQTSTAQP